MPRYEDVLEVSLPYANQLLREIEEGQNDTQAVRKNYTVFSANDDIRSLFIPHDSLRGEDLHDFHIQSLAVGS